MHCRQHSAWNCAVQNCWLFYAQQGYSHPGMIEYDLSSGGPAMDIGGGFAIDLETGELGVETPFGVVDV